MPAFPAAAGRRGAVGAGRSYKTVWDNVTHYHKIVLALRETRQIMEEIDEVIPEWPIE